MRNYFILSLFSLVCFVSCDPKKDQPPQSEDFSCIKIFDEQGQGLGLHGPCTSSNDWGNIPLSATEKGYLNFSDTVSLTGTAATTVTWFGVAPCPVIIGSGMLVVVGKELNSSPVKLKLAVVDESLNLIQKLAVRLSSNNGIQLYMDPSLYQTGQYYRMYYQISADGAPSIYEGYGNFLVCKGPVQVGTIESECM